MKSAVAASGPADPAIVWDRYIHPARWHEWSPQISSVDYPAESLQPGGHGKVHGPCGIAVDFEISAVDNEKRCWSWRVTLAGITLDMLHEVLPVSDDPEKATTTTLEISGPAPIVLGYLPVARIALGRLVR